MNHPDQPNLASAVEQQRRLAIQMRDRRNWILLGSFLVCLLVALTWMIFVDSSQAGNAILLAAVASPVLGLFASLIFARHRPSCPKCGYGWEIEDTEYSQGQNWSHCPGCGLKLNTSE
jgi:hypothetical protein